MLSRPLESEICFACPSQLPVEEKAPRLTSPRVCLLEQTAGEAQRGVVLRGCTPVRVARNSNNR